jgi:hypothetical protein
VPRERASMPVTISFTTWQFLKFVDDRLKTQATAVHILKDGAQALPEKKQQQSAAKAGQQANQQQPKQSQQAQQQNSPPKVAPVMSTVGGSPVPSNGGGALTHKQEKRQRYNESKRERKLYAFMASCDGGPDLHALAAAAKAANKPQGGGAAVVGNSPPGAQQGGRATSVVTQRKAPDNPQMQKNPATGAHKYGCAWCGQGHDMNSCGKVKDMPVQERWDRMRERMRLEVICVACLKQGHKSTDCDKACGVTGCLRRHATLLHMDFPLAK